MEYKNNSEFQIRSIKMANKMPRKGSAENSSIPHTRIDEESWINKYYEVGEKIGQGMFGKVFKVTHKETDEYWAMKVVNKEKAGGSAIKLLEREVAILKMVDQDNIIKLNEVFETGKKMFLVMELCEGGELADVLREKEKFSESDTKVIMKKMFDAISYLHKKDIVHRDLKLENILLSQNPKDPADKLHIKVTDFGLSVVKGGVGHDNMMQDFCGTPIYMSPEIIDNKAYSQQCDVWAMGVIMYSLLCGSPPFKANTEEELYEIIKKGEIDYTTNPVWNTISEDAKKCIELMLRTDPAHRSSASEVLHHAWITGIQRESRNVLDLMKQFRLEEEGQKSAINGEVENGEDPNSLSEEPTPETSERESRKNSAEGKKPGSGGKSGSSQNSTKSSTAEKSQRLSTPGQRTVSKSPAPKANNLKTLNNNTRPTTNLLSTGKSTAAKKKT
ncbi:serine/threonine-protein kinase 33-like isoform X1 [Mytilus trossulus]|uniref:serine/threonine-protein kinase 33-like isoform X1 n=2 Tax=Mytilus trossulus TaxID=6551 RepID=UPI0030074F0A